MLEPSNIITILSRQSRVKDDLNAIQKTFQIDVCLLILSSFLICTILTSIFTDWKRFAYVLIDNLALLLGTSIGK